MSQMVLTMKSEEILHQRYNASGIVFIKTGDKEITSFEFSRARNGKLYVASSTEAYEVAIILADIANETPEEIL